MDEIIFKALMRYFTTLENVGYFNYEDVYKIIYLLALRDILDTDFNGELTEGDIINMQDSLNCILGSSCLFPYPLHCNCLNN